jgi:glycosyltransferase involved in cell wall biosynthesis
MGGLYSERLMLVLSLHSERQPLLSVIVPVYNGAAALQQCLERVFSSDFSDLEVIVVLDGCTDSSAKIASSYPCKVISLPENRGPGLARNAGVKRSSGQILYFLDADVLVGPDVFPRLVEAFAAHPEYGAIFGSFEKDTGRENFVSAYKNLLHHYTHQHSNEEALTFCSGLGAVRRDAFVKIGGFDPKWWFMEDIDLGYRLHQAGYRIWLNKDLFSVHLKRHSLASLVRSDVLGRAIPWTRLMLETRLFRNDLNTRFHNVASVPVSVLLMAALLRRDLWLPMALPLAAIFLFLNRGFLTFLVRERGVWFAIRSAGMCWLGYLYSAVGAAAGALAYLRDRVRPGRGSSAGPSNPPENLNDEDRAAADDGLVKTASAGSVSASRK